MPNIFIIIAMLFVFAISTVIALRLAKKYPEKQYYPIWGWVVGVLIMVALYFIGKGFQ